MSNKSHSLLQFYPRASYASGYFPSFIPNGPRIDLHGSQNQRPTFVEEIWGYNIRSASKARHKIEEAWKQTFNKHINYRILAL